MSAGAPRLSPRAGGAASLRGAAEREAAAHGALMARAERLAATVYLGVHGRRRAGFGETFWQYRRAIPGDPASSVDWRRSARTDALFVRETEWEAAQTVQLWCDRSAAMRYASSGALPQKVDRAAELAAALALLLTRGGERTALLSHDADAGIGRPGLGEAHLGRVVEALTRDETADFGDPPPTLDVRGGRVVLISDFFGEESKTLAAIEAAAAWGLTGFALQINDPAEESFPFDGRILFQSLGGGVEYETERAGALRDDYVAALTARRARLAEAARRGGWRVAHHRTDESAAPALLWLAQGLSDMLGA